MFKRVVITEPGDLSALQVIQEAIPDPQPGEIRVKVQAAGVAYADVLMREGLYSVEDPYPLTPGYDVVGVVDALGEGVTGFTIGQTVAALTEVGGYTEMICRPAAQLAPVPDGIDPAAAVSLILNGLTAYQMLHRYARVQPGERVLIHGAGGGVGTLLLQLGKLAGLEMYGTASTSKHDLVCALGGSPIDYKTADFVAEMQQIGGVDVVFDSIGGEHLEKSYAALRMGGRLIVYGGGLGIMTQGRPDEIKLNTRRVYQSPLNPSRLFADNKAVMGYFVASLNKQYPQWYQADLAALFDLVKIGQLAPVIGARIPLDQVAEAHDLINRAAVPGKIVLVMG